MLRSLTACLIAAVSMASGPRTAEPELTVDPDLPAYQRARGVTGIIKSMGSDTLNNVMTQWAEDFRLYYPAVTIEIEGKGSKTAPPALIEGQAQFGPMSRPMKAEEEEAFEDRYGYKPTGLRSSIDTLVVWVHRDCPLESITLEQLQSVFSVEGASMTWGDLGATDARYRAAPISLYGRNSASGTYDFFKQHALAGADYKPEVKEQPGSSAVVQAIAGDPFGMGYSGEGYRTADVRPLPISADGLPPVAPTYDSALSGEYPLARFLYVYINHDPRTRLDPLRAEFVRFMFSREGQEAVLKQGFFPVPAAIAAEDLEKVGLSPNP